MVSHHLAMFGGQWYNVSGDVKYLMCHVNSQNHVIEGLYEWDIFMVYHPKFSGHRYCSSGDIMFLVCHLIKQDHIIKRSVDYKKYKLSHHPANFGGYRHCTSRDIIVLVCHMIY